MSASDHSKIVRQLRRKTAVLQKFQKHNQPKVRSSGITKRKCERCGRFGGHLKQYNLNLCRQCFREIAEEIGFKKYS